MTNSELLIEKIDSFYRKPIFNEDTGTHTPASMTSEEHSILRDNHKKIIDILDNYQVSVNVCLPRDNEHVFAIQDFSPIRPYEARFIGDYFYSYKYGFIHHITDNDGYGLITHWISTKTIDQIPNFDGIINF